MQNRVTGTITTLFEGSKLDTVTSLFGLQQIIKEHTHIIGDLARYRRGF